MCTEKNDKTGHHPNHVCPACGRRFYCNEAEGCWCEKIPLTRLVLSMLRRRYVNCLCEDCLRRYSLTRN